MKIIVLIFALVIVNQPNTIGVFISIGWIVIAAWFFFCFGRWWAMERFKIHMDHHFMLVKPVRGCAFCFVERARNLKLASPDNCAREEGEQSKGDSAAPFLR